MRTVFGHVVLLALVFAWDIVGAQNQRGHLTSSGSNGSVNPSSISLTHDEHHSSDTRQSTCQSGSVNYITHSLPQQCLSRSSTTTASLSTSTDNTTPSSSSSTPVTTPSSSTTTPTSTTISSSIISSSSTSSSTATTSTSSSPEPTPSTAPPEAEVEAESETDSPLDNSNFLSFEEWKKQNLVKAGQSPDHVGQQATKDKPPRNMPHIDNALDVLGDDSEIELDFSGFGRQQDKAASSNTDPQAPLSSGPALRSKDAGKTCKERSNYASFDCAATVLKSNPESKSGSAVLIENKDSYMLNICQSPNKFLILELCDDILIDTIVLANYEFFSSIFRTFRVSVSDRYPVKQDRWKNLGVFEARNTRSVQAFLIEQPLIWARYLRIEFLTQYGNEYYCPVSLLRVHGTTMMEEFRHQEELARGEISDDLEESIVPEASDPVVAQEPADSSRQADASEVVEAVTSVQSPPPQTTIDSSSDPISNPASASTLNSSTSTASEPHESANTNLTTSETVQSSSATTSTSVQADSNTTTPALSSPTQHDTHNTTLHNVTVMESPSTTAESVNSPTANSTSFSSVSTHPTTSLVSEDFTRSMPTKNLSADTMSESRTNLASSNSISQSTTNTTTSKGTSTPVKPSSAVSEAQQKPGTSTTSSVQSNPTTQESFFKSIHKRLQMLESNATLSLQYIEEQSRILRDAFVKVEKRQIKKTEAFLNNLNTTVFAELQDFKQQYDQLWQSTVIELENHREQYRTEIVAVSARLSIVADELVFQKRMAIVQSTLLMLCLGLVLFVRAGSGTGLDIPIIQQMVNKSHLGRRSSYYSPLNSPSPDQSSPPELHRDPRRRRSFWKSSPDTPASPEAPSNENGNSTQAYVEEHSQRGNPDFRFDPPTPTYEANHTGDSEMDGEDGILVSPTTSPTQESSVIDHGLASEEDPDMESLSSAPQETQSSPSTPSGSRDQQTSLKMLPAWPSSERIGENDNDTVTAAASEIEQRPAGEPIHMTDGVGLSAPV